MKIFHIVGARPNFMKLAPVLNALRERPNVTQTVVHTGQHFDVNMSDVFFQQLGIPAPVINLAVGSGSHAKQTAEIMIRLEPVLLERQPDIALVYGDVNSTVATALVCAKLGVPFGHVEAGLRSFDRTMPEEINRLVTDQLADLLFTPSEDADQNLRKEGISSNKIFRVGNVMIDSLVRLLPAARAIKTEGLPERYALVTLHRPSNVDDGARLKGILESLLEVNRDLAVVFPAHPRTRKRIDDFRLNAGQLCVLDPLPYVDFLELQSRATVVITDSGGIQEETTYLGVPCLTVRENTERPITVSMGTNVLVGHDREKLRTELAFVLAGKAKKGTVPPLWDGHAGKRIADALVTRVLGLQKEAIRSVLFVLCLILAATYAGSARPVSTADAPAIVIGFVGGFVKHDDTVHSAVQVAAHLRKDYPSGVYTEVLENSHREKAHAEIFRFVDTNHDGMLSADEKRNARVILYGHSWGASEAITLARELDGDGIPVLLTVQVDSVQKPHENDSVIPPNVAEAANFYQLDGFLHGEPEIRAADPKRTHIIGNFRFDYKANPIDCRQYPWYDRLFMRSHIEIECDPRVWNQVESLIRSRLPEQH